ncbi:MAG TPA: hypothetical protein VHO67_10070 [Polyangia bacterium]|nr:hypothetical protein [Polyangia bacterium]
MARAALAQAHVSCAPPTGAEPQLGEIDGHARLEWIDHRLAHEAPRMSFWNWGWGIGIGAAGIGTLIAVPFVNPEDRIDYYTGAGAAAIGVLPFVLSPPKVIADSRELHAQLVATPPRSDADVCRLLADAEQRLVRDARNEHSTTAWWAHVGNAVFNLGIVLFEGLGFNRWTGGLINGLSGAAVGEAVIFTQPTGTIRDLAAYNRGDLAQ